MAFHSKKFRRSSKGYPEGFDPAASTPLAQLNNLGMLYGLEEELAEGIRQKTALRNKYKQSEASVAEAEETIIYLGTFGIGLLLLYVVYDHLAWIADPWKWLVLAIITLVPAYGLARWLREKLGRQLRHQLDLERTQAQREMSAIDRELEPLWHTWEQFSDAVSAYQLPVERRTVGSVRQLEALIQAGKAEGIESAKHLLAQQEVIDRLLQENAALRAENARETQRAIHAEVAAMFATFDAHDNAARASREAQTAEELRNQIRYRGDTPRQ